MESNLDHLLNEKGSEVVNKIKGQIISDGAVRTGQFLNSVSYEAKDESLSISWINYGNFSDRYHNNDFSNIINEELDSNKFDEEVADAVDKDIQMLLDENIKI